MANKARVIGSIIIAPVSFLVAFFGVFNVLFSDYSGPFIWPTLVMYFVYVVLSFAWYSLVPVKDWTWSLWLAIPGVVLALWMMINEQFSPYIVVNGSAIILAVIVGSISGKFLVWRRK